MKRKICSDKNNYLEITKRLAFKNARRFLFRGFLYSILKKTFLVFLLVSGWMANAQKETIEMIDASEIRRLKIFTNEVFLLNIIASPVEQIHIKTRSDGEYFNNILVQSTINGDQLELITRYPERLINGFDKLSAHKVFALEIELMIPEAMEVEVTSNIASLVARGNFSSIRAGLKQGYCNLLDFSGKAEVNTYGGNILVETNSGLVEANSRHGKVVLPNFLPGRTPIKLTTIDGDITVRKTK